MSINELVLPIDQMLLEVMARPETLVREQEELTDTTCWNVTLLMSIIHFRRKRWLCSKVLIFKVRGRYKNMITIQLPSAATVVWSYNGNVTLTKNNIELILATSGYYE